MKILMSSYAFAPSAGGIETVGALLAKEWIKQGHEVRVVTHTKECSEMAGVTVLRRPSAKQLLVACQWSDVLFQNNLSVRFLWPALLLRKPVVATYHIWIGGTSAFKRTLKRNIGRLATINLAVSRFLASKLPFPARIMPNPYSHHVFRSRQDAGNRQKDGVLFVGRLVHSKGCHVLVDALHELRKRSLRPLMTIVGDGPEKYSLLNQISDLQLSDQVRFVGRMSESEVAESMRNHDVTAVPSVWEEPFGLVALEAAACGCTVVASNIGGLPEAMGPMGRGFAAGDSSALAEQLALALTEATPDQKTSLSAEEHLLAHRADVVAARYLEVFREAIEKRD
jgi:glycosyltransferase involved in cell wall biosynthesis